MSHDKDLNEKSNKTSQYNLHITKSYFNLESLFLLGLGGISILAGFTYAFNAAKKSDSSAFLQVSNFKMFKYKWLLNYDIPMWKFKYLFRFINYVHIITGKNQSSRVKNIKILLRIINYFITLNIILNIF